VKYSDYVAKKIYTRIKKIKNISQMTLLKYKRFSGLHIVCKACNRTIEVTQTLYKGCSHPIEKQKYKGLFSINGKRTTKDLKSLIYDEAVVELLNWKKQLENPISINFAEPKKEQQTNLFADWIWMYSDWLQNENVPKHEQKHRSAKYIKETVRYVIKFKEFLASKGINVENLQIQQIDNKLFGMYYEYLGETTKSAPSFNHCIRALKNFFKYIVDERQYQMLNPAKKAKLKYENPNPVSIDDTDFIKLLSVITEKDSVEIFKDGRKRNRFRTWMKDSFELSAYTGMRLEEVGELKYSDIKLKLDGKLDYLEGTDLKYQRAHNWDNTKPKKIVPIPITPELEQLLKRLKYKEHLDCDRYLIDGDSKLNRPSLAKEMSHAFTFFRRKAGLSDNFSIKHLRKTFLTKLETQTGLVESAGYQKTVSVIRKNYIDKRAVSREIQKRGFSYFGEATNLIAE
jgi:integrase